MLQWNTVEMICFSPTHSSRKIANAIASGLGIARRKLTDLTLDMATKSLTAEHEIAIITAPVYCGRVSPTAVERIRRFHATDCPAIVAVTYGNRDYEDALVELYDLAESLGFNPIAAGAFIGEHSFSRPYLPIAEERPDMFDEEKARHFGRLCLAKLESGESANNGFVIKGNRPYRAFPPSQPAAPVSTDGCHGCGTCVGVCPTHAIAIDEDGKVVTDKKRCIQCCACVKVCPLGARVFDVPFAAMLHEKYSTRREPEWFI